MSLASLAIAAASAAFALPLPAAAQTCPYNSTQGTCACPTSGAGATCFGGQLYRASDSTCQNDVRPCAANQNFSCSSVSCVCNTAAYPCGGCSAATSTIGAGCTAPTGGQYTNVCGACACPSGTTLCGSSNTCVTTMSCPAGTTFDPCTNSCNTPNVLVSPSFTQNGFINIAGDINERGGNVRLDYATGGGQGDFYMANGKAIRVDGAGTTSLSIGNWGGGGVSVNIFHSGNIFTGGISTIASDSAVAANTIETGNLCFGNGVNCRTSWPSTTDFNPSYVNVTGDTMTGDLNLTGASTDLFVAGNVGVGTTTPVDGRVEIVRPSTSYRANLILGTGANNDWELGELNTDNSFTFKRVTTQPVIGSAVMTFDTLDNVGIGTSTPAAKLDVFGTAKVLGLELPTGAGAGKVLKSDASGNATWQSDTSIGGGGTTNRIAKFTGAATIGDSTVFDNGTNVSVNATAPTARFQVQSDTYDFPSGAQQRRFTTSLTGAQIFLNDSSGSSIMSLGTGPGSDDSLGFNMNGTVPMLITSGGNIGMGTTTPGQRLDVSGNINVAGNAALGGYGIAVANNGNGGGLDVSTNSPLNGIPALRVRNSGTGPGIDVDGGVNSLGAHIKGNGDGYALDASVYDHSSPNTLALVMQVRRGTSGTPAVGMGGSIDFPLEGSGGSFYGGTRIGSVISSLSPWKTDFVVYPSSYSVGEKMRLTADGALGVNTTSPVATLDVNGTASLGTLNTATGTNAVSIGVRNDATGYNSAVIGGYAAATGNGSIAIGGGIDVSRKMTVAGGATIGLGYGSTIPTLVVTSAPNTAGTYGKVGVAAQSPAATLSVGGNGANVYATDLWVENNMHVQGNESVGSGRGRLRVGTAWNLPGMYAETNSAGQVSDLVLGASSDLVQINAGTFGRPYAGSSLALWGSRLSDTGGGVLHVQSGGAVVAMDGNDYVGIGTASPVAALHVANGPTNYTTANYRRSIQVGPESYDSGVITWPWDGSGRWGIFGNGSDLRISRTYWNGSSETPTYHVFLTSSGDMGVGTNISAVTAKLDVNGTERVRGNIWSDGNYWDYSSGWIYCGGGGDCACPNGQWVGRVWNSGQYIYCYGL